MSMVVVVPHKVEKTVYDSRGRVLEKAGQYFVSHGYDWDTGKIVILPSDEFWSFVGAHATFHRGIQEYILKG